MGRLLKTGLRWLAYTVFLVLTLGLFVYLTLPTKEIKAYLVRKAADEHQLTLEIEELKVAGLAGVQLKGVTITPMPTPEERETLAKAQLARKKWREAAAAAKADEGHGAKAEAGDDAADDGDATPAAKSPDKKAAPGSDAAAKADPDAPGDGDGKPSETATAKAKADAKAGKAKADASAKKAPKKAEGPPPLPPGPTPIFVEQLTAKLEPFGLLKGAIGADIDADLMGGRLALRVDQRDDTLTLKGDWDGLAVEQLPFAPKRSKIVMGEGAKPGAQVDLSLVGAIEGDIDLEVPLNDRKKPQLSKTTGTLAVRIVNALLGPGQIFNADVGLFDVPRIALQQLGGRLVFEKRKATFEDFKITGKDLEGDLQGHIQLADEIKRWGPRMHLRFKFSDAFLAKNKDVKTALSGLPKLRNATDREGYMGLQVTGSVGDLKPRLTRSSVYRRRASTRPGPAAKAKPTAGSKRAATRKTTAKPRPSKRTAKPSRSTAKFGGTDRVPARTARAPKVGKPLMATGDTEAEDEVVAEEEGDGEEEVAAEEEGDGEEKPEGDGEEKPEGDGEEKPEGDGEEKPEGEPEPE